MNLTYKIDNIVEERQRLQERVLCQGRMGRALRVRAAGAQQVQQAQHQQGQQQASLTGEKCKAAQKRSPRTRSSA